MAIRSEIFHRNRQEILHILLEHDVSPSVAELVLQGVLDSLPRPACENLGDPDKVLLERVREACRQVEDLRRQAARFVDAQRAIRLRAALKLR